MAVTGAEAGKQAAIYYQDREAQVYDLEYRWKTDDVDYWVQLAKEFAGSGGTALELGCGTGRVLVPVAESGVNVVGIDESPFMLARAKDRYERLSGDVQARIGLLEADMRTFKLEQKFKLIYVPFNAFLVLRTIEDQLATLNAVRQALAPGGVFAMDIFVPDVNRLVGSGRPPKWGLEVDETIPDLGIRLQRDTLTRYDTYNQQIMATFRMREYRDNILEREWLSDLNMCYLFPRELEHLLTRAGFEMVHFWGDYSRQEFWKMQQPRIMLPVARAARGG